MLNKVNALHHRSRVKNKYIMYNKIHKVLPKIVNLIRPHSNLRIRSIHSSQLFCALWTHTPKSKSTSFTSFFCDSVINLLCLEPGICYNAHRFFGKTFLHLLIHNRILLNASPHLWFSPALLVVYRSIYWDTTSFRRNLTHSHIKSYRL